MFGNIFSPIRIGRMEIPNRLVVPAMVMNFCNADGTATERYTAYHEAKALGGWGLIITEDYAVSPTGRGFPNIPGLWQDEQIESHARFTRRIHESGGRIFAQIYHAGRQTSQRCIGSQPVAPSPIPCPLMQEMPRELALREIAEIVEQFGECARRVKEAGFDGLEIHGGHGYLIAQFMSLSSNKRTDAYGGSLQNRMRFPLEVLGSIRARVGKDFPVIFRISGDELVPGGRNIEDTKAISRMLEEASVDALHISAGAYGSFYAIAPPAAVSHGWITDYAREVKSVVGIPVITVGRINDPWLADEIIASGKADLVAMGRASLADPALPDKALRGKVDDINACIGCLQGCIGRISLYQPATCMVNPVLGQEAELAIKPAGVRKKVFVAGGGPAGMEAAWVAAVRGHEVHLFEKFAKLGGEFYSAAIPPNKGEIAGFIIWLAKQMADHQVSVHLQTELTQKTVDEQKPDAVIIATGSKPLGMALTCPPKVSIVTAQDVLTGKTDARGRIAIIGGGMIGTETANHLAHHGKQVTIVEMLPRIAADVTPSAREFLFKDLAAKDVRVYVNAKVKEMRPEGLIIEKEGREENIGRFDTLVLATGVEPVSELAETLTGKVPEIFVIGDAVKIRKALEAIAEGYQAGLKI
ncbi:MAG: FAD-dependent oxidoreductase [Deltaproteobacteria bacterium]|nr:FAD-dependent oxidoreductase [Deltaproteobacteria bacterium]